MKLSIAVSLFIGSIGRIALAQPGIVCSSDNFSEQCDDDDYPYMNTVPAFAAKTAGWWSSSGPEYGCVSFGRNALAGSMTAKLLVAFSDKYVESNGRVFTVKNAGGTGGNQADWYPSNPKNGLYEVISGSSCMSLELLYEDDNIGQIVASSMFDPIQIIGVDQVTDRIYGYYEEASGWSRVRSAWGRAKDGSLATYRVKGEVAGVVGVAPNDVRFNLWNDSSKSFPDNFNYSNKGHIKCAARPASINDWEGFWANSRGDYCPGVGDNHVIKYTWYGSWRPGGPTMDRLTWTPALKLARLGPESNIFGISKKRDLMTLWYNEKVDEVKTVSFDHLPDISKNVVAVGGLDDGYARGVFVYCENSWDAHVYNVYWEAPEGWKTKEIDINWDYFGTSWGRAVYFGNHGGKTYLLHEEMVPCHVHPDTTNTKLCSPGGGLPAEYWASDLYRLDFQGGDKRYDAVLLS